MTKMTTAELEHEATRKLAQFFRDNGFTAEQRKEFERAMVEAAGIAARETAKRL